MISNTIAYLISRHYQREPIFEVLSHQDGISLPSMEQQRESVVHRVEEAMRPDVLALGPEIRVATALQRIAENPGNGALLVQPREGVWTVTTADALRAYVSEGKGDLALGSVFGLAAPAPVVHPDESLESVLRRVGTRPFLPVVHRADAQRLLGVVSVEDILSAYGRR
jgi:CIC family chloride channel protein